MLGTNSNTIMISNPISQNSRARDRCPRWARVCWCGRTGRWSWWWGPAAAARSPRPRPSSPRSPPSSTSAWRRVSTPPGFIISWGEPKYPRAGRLTSLLPSSQPDGGPARDRAGWLGGVRAGGERPHHSGHWGGGLCGRGSPPQTRSPLGQGGLQKVGRSWWILSILLSFFLSATVAGLELEPAINKENLGICQFIRYPENNISYNNIFYYFIHTSSQS